MNDLFSTDKRIIDLNAKDLFSIENFATLQELSGNMIDEKTQTLRNINLIDLDSISRNRSMYQFDGFVEALNSPYVQELIHRGTFFGELDHPDPNCSRERFMKVDKDNISHRIINPHLEGKTIKSNVQMVAPKGNIPWDWITKGSNISFSVRVLTPNYEERTDGQGQKYIYKHSNMRLITWDLISSAPGFKNMSIVEDVDSYDASKLPIGMGTQNSNENWEGIHINWTQGRKKDEFMRLLKSQESLPIFEDIYGFDMKNVNNISYSKEGLITLTLDNSKEYSRSIKIPTNVYKVNQVLGLE